MQPERKTQLFVCSLIALSRAADVVLTYLGTPDLTAETNPVVVLYGAGWPFMIALNYLAVMGLCFLFIWAWPRVRSLYPKEEGYGLGKLIRYVYTGRNSSWREFVLAPIRRDNSRLMGIFVPFGFIAIGIALSVEFSFQLALGWNVVGGIASLFVGANSPIIAVYFAFFLHIVIIGYVGGMMFGGMFLYRDYLHPKDRPIV